MATDEKEIEAVISGRVQGVNFRANTKQEADRLGLYGYVQNNTDGSVETVAQGDEPSLKAFVDYLQKGPPMAKVEDVDVQWYDTPRDAFTSFSIAPTE